jgi:hypothetical protein
MQLQHERLIVGLRHGADLQAVRGAVIRASGGREGACIGKPRPSPTVGGTVGILLALATPSCSLAMGWDAARGLAAAGGA